MTEQTVLRIGSRKSPLALTQTELVMAHLKQHHPQLILELVTFTTTGDQFLDAPLAQIGDKGLFVKELEEALLSRQIDLAVHSLKDMLSILPDGLAMHSILDREDPRDVLIHLAGKTFEELPLGAVIGTASLRRVAQLKRLRPDLLYKVVRGNLQTRLSKLESTEYHALVLAAAGVHRMGWKDKVTYYFDPQTEAIPAVGQGILAVEFREDDPLTRGYLAPLRQTAVEIVMMAERAFLRAVEGGCRLPIGAYAYSSDATHYVLQGIVLSPEGDIAYEDERLFTVVNAEQTGTELAQHLLQQGAAELLKTLKK